MKKVGIIGGSGFIGSHTTKKFLQEGFKVRVSTTDISAMLNNIKPSRNARVIYKNEAAKKDLGIEFNPAIVPLTEFSK
ncbi:NAD-dependent epimerase/dehydratase family protein [Labilibaculum antarcticum]|uniref:NAD-dependent epimerase/dehydratase domain-containing protein n=1 Tax=Labilibaculum antarcticum TaxID=1717717 RepID=A0A1Y1CMW1_9BACT|nr:NAD-dependent epimerase/dehydratase family protein [Labilibaculum antarcticum]BAX81756.1 hypothetical protein ALGA_3458 [Labilibaculum antarcticum]